MMDNLWNNIEVDFKNCLLQTIENERYRALLQIVKKENIFEGQRLFGDFDITVRVYDKYNNEIYRNELLGLNGNYKNAEKHGKIFKKDVNERYFS